MANELIWVAGECVPSSCHRVATGWPVAVGECRAVALPAGARHQAARLIWSVWPRLDYSHWTTVSELERQQAEGAHWQDEGALEQSSGQAGLCAGDCERETVCGRLCAADCWPLAASATQRAAHSVRALTGPASKEQRQRQQQQQQRARLPSN